MLGPASQTDFILFRGIWYIIVVISNRWLALTVVVTRIITRCLVLTGVVKRSSATVG